jgi:hypothetical protein
MHGASPVAVKPARAQGDLLHTSWNHITGSETGELAQESTEYTVIVVDFWRLGQLVPDPNGAKSPDDQPSVS